jgi:deoxyribose-phosphate aldolase
MEKTQPDIRQYIEQTILKPETTSVQIDALCNEAIQNGFLGVCVPPYYVERAASLLQNADVKLITVVGFPLGYSSTAVKLEETKEVIRYGADEVDMVLNIAAFKSGSYETVLHDMKTLADYCHRFDTFLKVIIETCLLSDDEIIKICALATKARVDFVKTSTGFSTAGATVHHIKLLRENLPTHIRLKASGGIKDKKLALDLIKHGADRLGTSSGLKLITA